MPNDDLKKKQRDVVYPKGNVPPPGDYTAPKLNANYHIPKTNRFIDLNQAVGLTDATVNRLRAKQQYEIRKMDAYISRQIDNLIQE